jgi:site-specific recombinase
VMIAAPLVYGVDRAVFRGLGHHLISADKAQHVFAAHSVLGPSVLFAALTGLFLWISSIVGAASDNWTRVTNLSDRLATNVLVMKRIGHTRARAYAEGVVSRMGGLAGNLCLGLLLGIIPAAGAIASLPIEVRHVTMSSGSVALALSAGAGSRADIALAIAGVVVIAICNVSVSFILALSLALRATRRLRRSASSYALVRIGIVSGFGLRRSPKLSTPAPAESSPHLSPCTTLIGLPSTIPPKY